MFDFIQVAAKGVGVRTDAVGVEPDGEFEGVLMVHRSHLPRAAVTRHEF